eukprot:4439606-Prymnesium_polylepis.3
MKPVATTVPGLAVRDTAMKPSRRFSASPTLSKGCTRKMSPTGLSRMSVRFSTVPVPLLRPPHIAPATRKVPSSSSMPNLP